MTIKSLMKILMLCSLALSLTWLPAQAQDAQKSASTGPAQTVRVPARWLTMDDVESLFGAPSNKSQPVGNPSISSWEYPGFYVYFEGDRVLDAFSKK